MCGHEVVLDILEVSCGVQVEKTNYEYFFGLLLIVCVRARALRIESVVIQSPITFIGVNVSS